MKESLKNSWLSKESDQSPEIADAVVYLLWEHYAELDHALLNPAWLLDPWLIETWNEILAWYGEGKPKDLTLYCQTKNIRFGTVWLKVREYLPVPIRFKDYVGELHRTYSQSKVFQFFKQVDYLDGENAILAMEDFVHSYRAETKEKSVVKSMKGILDFMERLGSRKDKSPDMLTGFPLIDEKLWGLHRGELITVGARTSRGKSVFALTVAMEVLKCGKKVLYFSTEMNYDEKLCRLLAITAGIPFWEFRKSHFESDEWKSLNKVASELYEKNNFFISDLSSPRLEDIASGIAEVSPDFVVVDYLGECEFPKADRHDLRIGEFMKRLKSMARDTQVSMLVASQLNRQVDSREKQIPTLADLKESGTIEQASDVVILLYDEPTNLPNQDIRCLNASIEKNRHGECGIVKMQFNTPYLKMTERSDSF